MALLHQTHSPTKALFYSLSSFTSLKDSGENVGFSVDAILTMHMTNQGETSVNKLFSRFIFPLRKKTSFKEPHMNAQKLYNCICSVVKKKPIDLEY